MKIGTGWFITGSISWVISIISLVFSPAAEQLLMGGTVGFISVVLFLSLTFSKTGNKTIRQRIRWFFMEIFPLIGIAAVICIIGVRFIFPHLLKH